MTTNLTFNAQLSTFSNLSYSDAPPANFNGWTLLDVSPPNPDGFYAVAYQNSAGQVAIAYRGTDGLKGDLAADGSFVAGSWHPQFFDAAAFTNRFIEIYGKDNVLVTGHSLGGGIAQVMARMFGLDGATFDAPGANGVTQSDGFAQAAALYGQPTGNQDAAAFMNYTSQGSAISAVDSHIGGTQSIVNLSDPSIVPLLVGAAGAMLGGPVLSLLGFGSVANILDSHPSAGIERAMWISAALGDALQNGSLKMDTMSWEQATGQLWPYEGTSHTVPVFTDATGKVVAVVDKNGDKYTVSTPDQSTVITLTPGATKDAPPQCTLAQAGEPIKSCTMSQGNSSAVTISTDSNADGQIDQINVSRKNSDGSQTEQLIKFDAAHPTGAQTLANAVTAYGPTLIDALSLIKAIQSGNPLPVTASGLRLANTLTSTNGVPGNYTLSGAANVGSSILSLMSLDAALQRGDALGIVTAGAQTLSFGTQAYLDFARANQVAVSSSVTEFAGDLSTALPY
ncbi:MAG: DUF2974 domain-containing protein, partial [Gallionella sp.]